ncbi:hypothetical protein Droror1_Dr00004808 [Drosera rotundifolia]
MVATILPLMVNASCDLMLKAWAECTTFVTDMTDIISPACCNAVNTLADSLKNANKSEKVEACFCFQASGKNVNGLDLPKVDKVGHHD